MTVTQALIIALFCYLAWIATPWLGGQGIGYHVFGKPLVAGLIVGIIMGDVKNGIIIGATINALYIGAITPGGAMAADLTIAGYVGTALALSTGVSAEIAVSIAVPLGLIGTFTWQLFATINSFLVHKTDEYAKNAETKKITFMTIGLPQIIAFILRVIPSFLVLYYGAPIAQDLLRYIPTLATDIMTVIGGVLPALGMGVLLAMLLDEDIYIGYFILGFIAVSALGLSVFTVTLVGISLAAIFLLTENQKRGDENVV